MPTIRENRNPASVNFYTGNIIEAGYYCFARSPMDRTWSLDGRRQK